LAGAVPASSKGDALLTDVAARASEGFEKGFYTSTERISGDSQAALCWRIANWRLDVESSTSVVGRQAEGGRKLRWKTVFDVFDPLRGL